MSEEEFVYRTSVTEMEPSWLCQTSGVWYLLWSSYYS